MQHGPAAGGETVQRPLRGQEGTLLATMAARTARSHQEHNQSESEPLTIAKYISSCRQIDHTCINVLLRYAYQY